MKRLDQAVAELPRDPAVTPCPLCGCPLQGGPLGRQKHNETVHPDEQAQAW